MKIYAVHYRWFDYAFSCWCSKVSQTCYKTIEAAQQFIETRLPVPSKISEYYYQAEPASEYYIVEMTLEAQI